MKQLINLLIATKQQSVRYREESLELHKKIEDIRDKIAKSTQMIQQLNSNEYGYPFSLYAQNLPILSNAKDDRLLLENNLKRLHQRKKDFESEYNEVIEQLRKCNREVITRKSRQFLTNMHCLLSRLKF